MKLFKVLFLALFMVAAAVSFVGCTKAADTTTPAASTEGGDAAATPSTDAPAPAGN